VQEALAEIEPGEGKVWVRATGPPRREGNWINDGGYAYALHLTFENSRFTDCGLPINRTLGPPTVPQIKRRPKSDVDLEITAWICRRCAFH
jgi:hypothetical protein